jgi:hypothetical protein
MLITKTTPVGIDLYIQKLQTKIHAHLTGVDGLNLVDTDVYKCYGRCYRNKTESGYIAENYESTGEYREVYWDDNLFAISFFGLTNDVKTGVNNEVDVHLVFFANLQKCLPAITHRADEELRLLITNIIGKHSFGFSYVSTEMWIENVLKEYSGSRRDNRLSAVDMHPIHCFRINLKLLYNPNKNC